MAEKDFIANAAPTYLINQVNSGDTYSLWRLNMDLPELFEQILLSPGSNFPSSTKLCPIGGYMLSYDLSQLQDPKDPHVPYDLFEFDPTNPDPLSVQPLQSGKWKQHKFWQYFDHYTWDASETDIVQLVPMTGYVMAYMPTAARGTYMLWNFDPAPSPMSPPDPLPTSMGPQDAFAEITGGSALLPMGNYVLEWIADHSKYRVWNFDPQNWHPLSMPTISEGTRPDIDASHHLIAMGENILDIAPGDGSYRLWGFDPFLPDPFVGPLKQGALPQGFDVSGQLTPVQMPIPIDAAKALVPGTMDFMRTNIEHVVVYMLESRTMDSVLGWLYEADAPHLNYVNAEPPFKANSKSYTNTYKGTPYPVHQYEDGKLSDQFVLSSPKIDPFHSTADSIQQQYSGGFPAYQSGAVPDMGGFVSNNLSPEAMSSFSPTQLPVLNGLAENYAVSDYWFSPMPGGTIANRGFALSGSNYNITVNCEGEPQYTQYAERPLRQPIWKVLQNNGHQDWKIYYSVEWENQVFTYHLYMRNQLPSVDKSKFQYVQPLSTFIADAKAGMLPKFSFLEPAWIAPSGATSYHPGASGDMVPGERKLKEIYEALRASPQWDKTALVITFSKGGGMYDHEAPPMAQPAWPRDVNDGFKYDVLGPRVPTIVVSPRVKSNTVFRSGQPQPYEGTSLLSTVLDWYGIPRARWGLGDRVQAAPTFESVFELSDPRTDHPKLSVPYDKDYPPIGSDG